MINLPPKPFIVSKNGGLTVWLRDGLDFAHGLGHGVGSYLSVHEGEIMFDRTNGLRG